MYAIFEDGGHQYRAVQGERLLVDLRDTDPGVELVFDRVLMVDGQPGQPTCPSATVKAKVLGEVKGEKIYVQKFRRRKNYRRRTGHRQRYIEVEIVEINCGA